MSKYNRTIIFNPEGNKIWSGAHKDKMTSIDILDPIEKNVALGFMLGSIKRIDDSQEYSSKEIFKKAIELGFVSVQNNIPGFVTLLPKTKIIEQLVTKINADHFKKLNAVEVSFPTFFDYTSKEIKDLAHSYEIEERMFKLGGLDEDIRVSYAADPGLFLWLKNKTFNKKALPYAIYSQTQVFRRFKAGELGGFPRLREFPLPDMHIFCKRNDAKRLYIENMKTAAENMRFLLGEDWTFVLDVTEDLYLELNEFFSELSKAINKVCIVNILAEKPRYYDMKTVFMMDAGDCAIMNYNMQWDQENAARFNIRSEDGEDIVILHGTLMHSWYKILPVFINKLLVDRKQEFFPYHIAPLQVSIIPMANEYLDSALSLKKDLMAKNVRCTVISDKKNLSKAIQASNKQLVPYFIILGQKEIDSKNYSITDAKTKDLINIDKFLLDKQYIHEMTPVTFFDRYDTDAVFANA